MVRAKAIEAGSRSHDTISEHEQGRSLLLGVTVQGKLPFTGPEGAKSITTYRFCLDPRGAASSDGRQPFTTVGRAIEPLTQEGVSWRCLGQRLLVFPQEISYKF